MSSVETGQTSAVETGQMSAAATSVTVLPQQQTSILFQQQACALVSTDDITAAGWQASRLLLRQDRCLLLGQGPQGYISAVEIGQMSAAERGPMCSVAGTDNFRVSTHNIEVSEVSSAPISQCSSLRNLNCGNIMMFKSRIGGLALNCRKWPPGLENRSP